MGPNPWRRRRRRRREAPSHHRACRTTYKLNKAPSAPVSHDQDCLLLYLLPFHSRPHRTLVTSYLPIFVPKYQFAIGTHHSSCLDLLSFHPCLSSPHISFVSSTELSCPSKPPSSPDPHQLNEFFSRLHPPKLPAFEQLDGQL